MALSRAFPALLLLAIAACASSPADDVPTPTNAPKPAETASDPATALIWQLIDTGLQHVASGYICPPNVGDFALTGEEAYDSLPRSRDVACVYEAAAGGAVKLHLTDFGRAVSPAAHLKGTDTTIARTYGTLVPRPVPTTPGQTEPAAPHASAFQIEAISDLRPEIPVETATWITVLGPWHIKARATYEADRAEAVAALVNALFARAPAAITPPTPAQEP